MAREGHWGDRAGGWNSVLKQLWAIPSVATYVVNNLEVLDSIRKLRKSGTGNTVNKTEARILLAIRDGLDWRLAASSEVRFIKQEDQGGRDDDATNIRLILTKAA